MRVYCCKHNPESIQKQREYCRKYHQSEKGYLKNLEANRRMQARYRDKQLVEKVKSLISASDRDTSSE